MSHKEIFERTAKLVGGRAPFMRLSTSLLRPGARIIETVGTAIGLDPPISSDLVAGAGLFNWYSSEKAVRELGYAVTPFGEMILAAYGWYRENGFL